VAKNDGPKQGQVCKQGRPRLLLRLWDFSPDFRAMQKRLQQIPPFGQTKPEYGRIPELCSTRRVVQHSECCLLASRLPRWEGEMGAKEVKL
jgi:hypothetical protein